MREVLTKVYTYNELSEKAKERARQYYGSFDSGDANMLTDNFKEMLDDFGYKNAEVSWQLNYCQGDGVSFTGEWQEAELMHICNRVYRGAIPRNIKRILPLLEVQYLRGDSHHCHERTVHVGINFKFDGCRDLSNRFMDCATELEEVLNQDRVDMCKQLERVGYKEIERVEGEENFAEMCAANECEFYEDGEMY